MATVAIVRANGDGGIQDPTSGTYISSQRDTVVAYTPWVENMVNHEKATLVRELEGSDFNEFSQHLRAAFDEGRTEEEALERYEAGLPVNDENAEKVTVAATPADLEPRNTEAPGRTGTRTGRRKGSATGEAAGETNLGEANS